MAIDVSVWWVDLARAPVPTPAYLDSLSLDERARHARYLRPEPAHHFAVTRIALRRLLAQRTGSTAAAVRIDVGAHGKPVVADGHGPYFNVSHCATCALIAICETGEVGIDVEQASAVDRREAVTTSICSPTELAWLRDHPAADDRLLTRLWTRKEAILKACGVGLGFLASELELGPLDATQGGLQVPGFGRVGWRDLALPSDDVASVAVRDADGAAIRATVQVYAG